MLNINDEFFKLQWYLRKYPPFNYDMNVVPAWQECINGTGITVGVVDGGIDWRDRDLFLKQNIMGSKDLEPRDHHDLRHGTMLAGVIAARENNGHLGVGIAFGAKIADLRALTQHPTTTLIGKALHTGLDVVDIYCCAFTNFPSGFKTYPLNAQVKTNLQIGTSYGRSGKGSIYVWSTGNGGEEHSILRDSCAYEGLVNNIYVIPVA
ncbi:uncharacterized protein LOC134249401, partial [Saccostrea cucullata]|uniref:uncharacterized protein LOC134249401 n=1 Tax=Saccostrea cuccullata TaxID=36930 RepID=UPI002ED19A26